MSVGLLFRKNSTKHTITALQSSRLFHMLRTKVVVPPDMEAESLVLDTYNMTLLDGECGMKPGE